MGSSPALTLLRQWQSETAAIREAPEPLAMRSTTMLLSGLIAIALLLTVIVPVDRVVTSTGGTIISIEPPTVVQSLDSSIIKSIDVSDGQRVVKGQLLARLDPTFAEADVEQLKNQIASLDAQIARADAENSGSNFASESGQGTAEQYRSLQASLLLRRRAQYESQIASFDAKIKQTEATVEKFRVDQSHYQEREKIARQVEKMRSDLLKKQAGSLLNLLTATDARLEMLRTMDSERNGLAEAQHSLAALQADRASFVSQWATAIDQELVTARNGRDAALAQLAKATKHHDLVELRASEDAVVLTSAKLSVGSILREGDVFFRLAPLRTPMEAEVRIAAKDIGFLRAGDPCVLKITAFNFFEHGTADGTVRWISEGAFTTDDDGRPVDAPFYKARITINRYNFVGVPENFRLIPGMTVGADVKVGTRSLFRYLVGGALHGAGEAMREP